MMSKTMTTRYGIVEHLRSQEEIAMYLNECQEEADGDAAFIARRMAILPESRRVTGFLPLKSIS
jgi:DNA-binding phage protein